MQTDHNQDAGDASSGASGPPLHPPSTLPGDGAPPPTAPATASPSGDEPPDSRMPGRRSLIVLAALAAAVVFVAAGFGLAQLVDGGTVDATISTVAAENAVEEAASADPPADATPDAPADATPDGSEPAPPSMLDELPFLDQLPLDPDQLARLFDEFQQRFGDDFALPFDELPAPEDLPGLDQLPFDPDELARLFEDLPFDEGGLEELLDRLRERFGDDLLPGSGGSGSDDGSPDGGAEA